jgi:hypothetical protein
MCTVTQFCRNSSRASPAAAAVFVGGHCQGPSFLRQLRALCWKNWLIVRRAVKATAGQLLTPIVVVILLVIFQSISNAVLSHSKPYPTTSPVPALPRYLVPTPLPSVQCRVVSV